MIVDDIDEEEIFDAPAAAPTGQQPTPVAAQLELPSPAGQASLRPPPEPEIELTPAASAAELEEQVAELMGRDRQGAINMVRAVLCRCTPTEFEQIDVRALEAEAKRLQIEVKRQEKEAEKNAKRLAKIAEDEARRLQREADQEAKARQRLELAAQKKREKLKQTVTSDASREKAEASAAKKGLHVGMEVEAALSADGSCVMGGGSNYEGSWYVGTIAEFSRGAHAATGTLRALVRFQMHEEMSACAAAGRGGREEGEEGEEAAAQAAVQAATQLSSWWALDSIRPAPPPPPANFGTLLEPGQTLEAFLEGGWWEVELLGSSRDAELAVPDPGESLQPGSLVSIVKQGSEYDGLCGSVVTMDAGWVKVRLAVPCVRPCTWAKASQPTLTLALTSTRTRTPGLRANPHPNKVHLPEAQLKLRSPPPRAEKHFRHAELELASSSELTISSPQLEPLELKRSPPGDGAESASPAVVVAECASPLLSAEEATYVVRLLTATAEGVGVYSVPYSRLRPGFQWRPSTLKWVGRWAVAAADRKGRARGGGGGGGGGTPLSEGARIKAGAGVEEGGGAQAAGLQPEGEQLLSEWPLGKRVEVRQLAAPHRPSPPLIAPRRPSSPLAAPHRPSPPLAAPRRPSPHLTAAHRPSQVMQQDEGYEGSWYAGTVTGYEPPLVVVRHDAVNPGSASPHYPVPPRTTPYYP